MSATFLRRVATSQTGSAMVELAVGLPVLVLVLLGTIDFARVFYTAIGLTNAARAGAQYGSTNLAQSGNTATMVSTAQNAGITGVSAVASRLCQCATDNGATFSATSPTANNCTAPVATSCPTSGTHRVMTVTVTATKTFTTTASIPGVPSSIPLSRTATLRVSE